ncbi:glycosyl transferase family protein [Puniceicoccus vermicola]|uniref:Glycosyl transferase family protein n=1 Tax=Puniceicoccus vermicola TaxID=388746 RepID=A0A7X1AXZ0_9BACT|nr:glycosyl transferase family protein [Puniceicoccus vermicola]
MLETILFIIWLICRVIMIGLIIIFLVSGLDDFFVDLVYYVRGAYRFLFKRNMVKPVTREQLESIPEKPVAIMVPAWQESAVIADMILNFRKSVKYDNWVLFVGTYPNDPDTFREAERARCYIPNTEVVVTPAPGPTCKSDCLNWVYQGILLYEERTGIKFDIFLMHDAEDMVHPDSVKFYNYLMPRMDFIQTPVVPLSRKWYQLVGGVYMDEFAESHLKDMRMREFMTGVLPSAGVGTALSRAAIEYLAKQRRNQIFDVTSLTEDYIMGLSLRGMRGKKIFLQQYIEVEKKTKSLILRREKTKKVKELIATKEYFPHTFNTSSRQKSRWTLGIALQGWRVGWSIHPLLNYWLMRDRKGIVNSFAVILGYCVAVFLGLFYLLGLVFPALQLPLILTEGDWVVKMLYVVMGLFAWRLLNRFLCTTRFYNLFQGLLSPIRMLVGNFVNFRAAWIAVRQFTRAKIRGETPAWIKTDHAFPSQGQLKSYHRRIGEILTERGLVTEIQLAECLKLQEETGRKLGEILVEKELLWEEELVEALAVQNGNAFVELDPYAVAPDLLTKIPEELAREMRIFPVSFQNNVFVLATDIIDVGDEESENNRDRRERELGERFGCAIRMAWASARDIDFAIDRAYKEAPAQFSPIKGRLGERLVQMGKLTRDELVEALRIQKRSREKLGHILIGMGKTSQSEIDEVISYQTQNA